MMDVALVSGGSRGIGAALVARCRSRFDAVIVIGRNPPPIADDVTFVAADLSTIVDWDQLLAGIPALREPSRVVFFDNAAELRLESVGTAAFEAAVQQSLMVNVLAPISLGGALLRRFAGTDVALIFVHLTTGAARRGIAQWGSYCASKAAARLYYETLALEHPHIRVELCDPGVVDTDMQVQIRQKRGGGSTEGLASADEAAQRIFASAGL